MADEQVASEPASPTPAAKMQPPANPVRRVTLVVMAIGITLFAYGIAADRITPYTAQALVQAYLVKIAPEVGGRVIEVGIDTDQRIDASSHHLPEDVGYEALASAADRRLGAIVALSKVANETGAGPCDRPPGVRVSLASCAPGRARAAEPASRSTPSREPESRWPADPLCTRPWHRGQSLSRRSSAGSPPGSHQRPAIVRVAHERLPRDGDVDAAVAPLGDLVGGGDRQVLLAHATGQDRRRRYAVALQRVLHGRPRAAGRAAG